MYKIIGGDGKEYGPVTADQIRDWVREGRANASTRAAGIDGEWKALTGFPEFADLFAGAATATPAYTSPPAEPGAPSYAPYSSPGDPAASTTANAPRQIRNWLIPAVIATVCCCPATGIPAIVYAARANSRKSAGDWAGAEKAAKSAGTWFWVSLVLSIVGNICSAIFWFVFMAKQNH